jgi:trans-2,3-dihydro-3-hydroxyanthranilate isomerase
MSLTRSYRYLVIDVFTRNPFEGNPLAVFPEADGLTSHEMQKIANEFNLSETVFLLPTDTAGECDANTQQQPVRRVRIFTPVREMRFAGHPTIGAAWVLIQEQLMSSDVTSFPFSLSLPVGDVPIVYDRRDDLLWLTTPPITFGPLFSVEECVAILGLSRDDALLPDTLQPQWVSAGVHCHIW